MVLDQTVSAADFVKIADPFNLSYTEKKRLLQQINAQNFALYCIDQAHCDVEVSKDAVKHLGLQLGLKRLDAHLCADDDAITPLALSKEKGRQEYIPYTDKPISWHTDGYYNPPDKSIRAIILHCVQQAKQGGANQILNHEILYAWLKQENPRFIKALGQPDVMTIPENIKDGKLIREVISGPVFSYDKNGSLHMRYTARQRNIIWKNDPVVLKAVAKITELLNKPGKHIHKVRLEPGQGIVCNNVLHNREGFVNDEGNERIMLRARYYERVN